MMFGSLRNTLGAIVCASLLSGTTSCLDRPVCDECKPETSNVFVQRVPTSRVDKIDLVFMIDNSSSMDDKQALLARAVPSLMDRFVTPLCVDREGRPNGERSTNGACASGAPEFPPMEDIHIAVVSSSLGTQGMAPCSNKGIENDRAWLLPRARPGQNLPSWNGSGFLAWDPTGKKNTPPGTRLNEELQKDFRDMVTGVGDNGCGFEASLESWYQFLIAPDPPEGFEQRGAISVPVGVDNALLAQRASFLRPDSLVVIVMLSDENDCSFLTNSSAWQLAQNTRFPRGTAVCATNPNDPCCRSCKSDEAAPPAGCQPLASHPECSDANVFLRPEEDPMDLRCFDQKRRFGFDLLQPIDRYVRGLTSETVYDREGRPQPNFLFAARDQKPARAKNLVYLAGIVGVPWQDIATPESLTGPGLRYLNAEQLVAEKRWDLILGDPSKGVPPGDPHMIESVQPRSGNHPFVAGGAIAPESSTSPSADVISGHEQLLPDRNDLQYACIFELETPQACPSGSDCGDCSPQAIAAGRALCKPPGGGPAGTTQYYAKAYPGTRQLRVLQGIGSQAIVASTCPKIVRTNDARSDPNYGYNPAVDALVDRLKAPLANQCLARAPAVNDDGSLSCAVVEAGFGGSCDCSKPGRKAARPGVLAGVRSDLKEDGLCDGTGPACKDVCACELGEASGDALAACRSTADPAVQAPGYCYIEPGANLGDPELVRDCPESRKRLLRFVGPDTPAPNSFAFMACIGATLNTAP